MTRFTLRERPALVGLLTVLLAVYLGVWTGLFALCGRLVYAYYHWWAIVFSARIDRATGLPEPTWGLAVIAGTLVAFIALAALVALRSAAPDVYTWAKTKLERLGRAVLRILD